MSKRRKKQAAPVMHLSTGPLPVRLMPGFGNLPLGFTDASRLRHGGLSVVLYADAASEPLAVARCVPLVMSSAPVSARTRFSLYLHLIRWARPPGWLVCLWPTLSALWIAADGFPGWHLLVVFVLGTFLMRSAGAA